MSHNMPLKCVCVFFFVICLLPLSFFPPYFSHSPVRFFFFNVCVFLVHADYNRHRTTYLISHNKQLLLLFLLLCIVYGAVRSCGCCNCGRAGPPAASTTYIFRILYGDILLFPSAPFHSCHSGRSMTHVKNGFGCSQRAFVFRCRLCSAFYAM